MGTDDPAFQIASEREMTLIRRRLLRLALGTGLLVAGALALATLKTFEILYENEEDHVLRVRLFGHLEFDIASETRHPPVVDIINSNLLLVASTICLVGLLITRLTGTGHTRRSHFFLAGWLGMAYLAVDDQFALHESLGYNLSFLASLPGIEHPDDPIMLAYALVACMLAFYFRREILASRGSAILFAAAFLFSAQAILSDLVSIANEEYVEIVASAAFVGAFAIEVVHLIRDQLRPPDGINVPRAASAAEVPAASSRVKVGA